MAAGYTTSHHVSHCCATHCSSKGNRIFPCGVPAHLLHVCWSSSCAFTSAAALVNSLFVNLLFFVLGVRFIHRGCIPVHAYTLLGGHCRQSRPSSYYQAKVRPSLYVWSTEAKTGDTGDAATVEAFQRHAQDEYVHAGLSASGPEPLTPAVDACNIKSEGDHGLVHRSECWSNVHVTSLSCQHLLHTPNRRDDQTDHVKTNSSTVDVSYDFENT